MNPHHPIGPVHAVGFDLFNTLVVARENTLEAAMERLMQNLKESGFDFDTEAFHSHYTTAAAWHIERSRKSGEETHNRFWICDTLNRLGNRLSPDDSRIEQAVEAYFSAFYPNVRLIPGTEAMLETLYRTYPLGLLSNFTHGPAARKILSDSNISQYFKTIIISGEIGYRKPHPNVFHALAGEISQEKGNILFVGDDPETDIKGALHSGLRPVWMAYARERKLPFTSGVFSENTGDPDPEIPRIASWDALFDLLNRQSE